MLYDDHKITLMVKKDGIIFKLIPFVEDENHKGSENNYWEKRVLLCSTKEFMKEEEKK